MQKILKSIFVTLAISLIWAGSAAAQDKSREVYTGTVLSYGNGFGRSFTRPFTLTITGRTSDQEAQRLLGVLQDGGQDTLLNSIKDNDLGSFSVGANLGRTLNVVRESVSNGQRRIFIVFERWTEFAEVRGGYRSLDYPFGVIELYIDERTGKGEGTYIAAAKIRWTQDKKNNQNIVEIENFATFPARLLAVTLKK